jgi:hypothetical protein
MPRTLGKLFRDQAEVAADIAALSGKLRALGDEAERAVTPYLSVSRRGFTSNSELLDRFYGASVDRERTANELIRRAEAACEQIGREFNIVLETSFDDGTQKRIVKALTPSMLMAGSSRTNYRQFRITLERLLHVVEDLGQRLPHYESTTQTATSQTAVVAAQMPTSQLRILFLAAEPIDAQRLRLDEEVRAIGEKLRASRGRELIRLDSAWAVRPDDVMQELTERRPHIVHFSGHGTAANEIVLLGPNGDVKPVPATALKTLFATMKDDIRVVVLNACYSDEQARGIAESVDCTVGMTGEVDDEAARIFAAAFYRALGFGKSVARAFDEGRTALLMDGYEGNGPKLVPRAGVDPSTVVFL